MQTNTLMIEPFNDFVSQNENTKSSQTDKVKIIKQLSTICRREHYTHDDVKYIFRRVKDSLDLRPSRKPKTLPTILTDGELETFFQTIEQSNVVHAILFRTMYVTGCRVAELCAIKISDIDIEACKISIVQGKGSKDRTVLFPADFKLTLKTYLNSVRNQTWLFESSQYRQYSTRRIQQLFKHYLKSSRIGKDITPHSLRHQCLTFLTAKGLTDNQIMLVSGHSNKDTLQIYQHLSLANVEGRYQEAFKS